MGEKIARHYVADKNPEGAFFPGVPLRDLTEDEFDALPEWLQRSVDAHDMYRKTAPPTRSPRPRPRAKAKTPTPVSVAESSNLATHAVTDSDVKDGGK